MSFFQRFRFLIYQLTHLLVIKSIVIVDREVLKKIHFINRQLIFQKIIPKNKISLKQLIVHISSKLHSKVLKVKATIII